MDKKKKILIISGGGIALVIFAVILFLSITKKDPNPAPSPDLDPNAVVYSDPAAEKPEGIRIPGYPRITISADTKDVTMNLMNPEGNPCYFTFEIVLTDEEETLFTSKLVEPGKAVTNVTLSRALERGEYPAMIRIKTTSLEDGRAMNGANVETILVVQ